MVPKLGRTKKVIKDGKISENMESYQLKKNELPLLEKRQKYALK